jgi:hypothetical protein
VSWRAALAVFGAVFIATPVYARAPKSKKPVGLFSGCSLERQGDGRATITCKTKQILYGEIKAPLADEVRDEQYARFAAPYASLADASDVEIIVGKRKLVAKRVRGNAPDGGAPFESIFLLAPGANGVTRAITCGDKAAGDGACEKMVAELANNGLALVLEPPG